VGACTHHSEVEPKWWVQAPTLRVIGKPFDYYGHLKPDLRENKREKGVWQRRFWEHCIRDEADYREHMRYCWKNPVKHGLIKNPEDWPYSSIHRDIKNGTYAPL